MFSAVGMDLMTVDPRFLYSNATSHKWALGGKQSLTYDKYKLIFY